MNIKPKFDPLNHFQNVPQSRIIEALGVLPFWVCHPSYWDHPLQEALELQYQFGPLINLERATVTPEGIHHYPGDPDQYPLISIKRGDETFYQYEHAIVAIINAQGTSFVTRMD